MWGIVPAAGLGSRIQPLAFSKELLPVGSRRDEGRERPRAVSEYLVDRMIRAGVTRLCMVISPGKSDIVAYYGAGVRGVPVCYVVQPEPAGLCDAVFRALPLIRPEERVIIGLPDTVWFPEDALCRLGDQALSFLLFPVTHPERFDAVLTDEEDRVLEIQVKREGAASPWIWGALKLRGSELAALQELHAERGREDVYLGSLVNAYLARGGAAWAVRAGEAYVDVGTLDGYREAMRLLEGRDT
jgi:glucose-1-phosphate thymidylyltransferase